MDWSPQQYLNFADERSRPARDLLAQIPSGSPRLIYDLGCGPGNSTALLAERYPDAEIIGLDNSETMLSEARRALPQREFILADLAQWRPERSADALYSNAALHWVPDHLDVMSALMETLPKGGVLAVQMPDNLDEASHRMICETAEEGPWAAKLKNVGNSREKILAPEDYRERLMPWCARVDVWHTIYYHPLDGAAGIAAWMQSTGLRPFLAPLEEVERADFVSAYTARIAQAYPAGKDGKVLLRFPRLFITAVRG